MTLDWPHATEGPTGADIVAIGFQEVVPLNAGNVIAGKKSCKAMPTTHSLVVPEQFHASDTMAALVLPRVLPSAARTARVLPFCTPVLNV